ncbi:MATE family efflux transporter, partial [Clostridium sp. SL.3.18]|nr:MATE family efflux transporter [Clostridium sp. SL.3.18]
GMRIFYTVMTGILLLVYAPQVIGVFTNNQDVVAYGVYIMKFFCPFYWILAILQVASGTIRGTGKTLQTMLIFLLSLCIFRVLWIWGALAVSHEIFRVMVAYPLSW